MTVPDVKHYSFSGADIIAIAVIGGVTYNLGNLQTISISTYRDTTPVRALGLDRPVEYKQGTRSVSGSLVFTKVNRSELDDMINANSGLSIGDTIGHATPDRVNSFDVHIHKATEYGDFARDINIGSHALVKGVTLMTSGAVMSVHDIYSEQTYNYVALEYKDFNLKDIKESVESLSLSEYFKRRLLRSNN